MCVYTPFLTVYTQHIEISSTDKIQIVSESSLFCRSLVSLRMHCNGVVALVFHTQSAILNPSFPHAHRASHRVSAHALGPHSYSGCTEAACSSARSPRRFANAPRTECSHDFLFFSSSFLSTLCGRVRRHDLARGTSKICIHTHTFYIQVLTVVHAVRGMKGGHSHATIDAWKHSPCTGNTS